MSRRKLEVTATEMLRLREHPYCLSNAQIAKRLDTQSLTRLVAGERAWLVDSYNQCVELEQPLKFLTAGTIHSLINELTYFEQLLNRAREEGKSKCL